MTGSGYATVSLLLLLVFVTPFLSAQTAGESAETEPGIEQEPLQEGNEVSNASSKLADENADEKATVEGLRQDEKTTEAASTTDEATEKTDTEPRSTSDVDKERKQQTLRVLLGTDDDENENEDTEAEAPADTTDSSDDGAQPQPHESEDTADEDTPQPAPLPADTSVPRLDLDEGRRNSETDSDRTASPTIADDRTVQSADGRKISDGGRIDRPATSTDSQDVTATNTAGGASESVQKQKQDRVSSATSAVIIGLIVLAILLVALAAIIGVMAAQRANRNGVYVDERTDTAYLSASGAPNIALDAGSVTFGRGQSCDVQLADEKASTLHARIQSTEKGYIISDLDSENGTLVNGRPINTPTRLEAGDTIQMGDISVTFHDADREATEKRPDR